MNTGGATSHPRTPGNGKVATILVIEDHEPHSALIKALLRRPGVQFLQARRAQQGLKLALERRPDLVLLDILMPPRNAWYVLEELKRNPATRHIPVIVVTIVDDEARVRALGADAYIRKPYRGEILRRKVGRYIGGYDGKENTPGR